MATSASMQSYVCSSLQPTQLSPHLKSLTFSPTYDTFMHGLAPDALEALLIRAQACPLLESLELQLDLTRISHLLLRASSLAGLQLPRLRELRLAVETCRVQEIDVSIFGQPRTWSLSVALLDPEEDRTPPNVRQQILRSFAGVLQASDRLSLNFHEHPNTEQRLIKNLRLAEFSLEVRATTVNHLPQAPRLNVCFTESPEGKAAKLAWASLVQCPDRVQLEAECEVVKVTGCLGAAPEFLQSGWQLVCSAILPKGLPTHLMIDMGDGVYVLSNTAAAAWDV